MNLEVNKDECIGCQCCVAMKSDNMIMEDGKAKVIVQPTTEEEKKEIIKTCPVGAIKEKQGE